MIVIVEGRVRLLIRLLFDFVMRFHGPLFESTNRDINHFLVVLRLKWDRSNSGLLEVM